MLTTVRQRVNSPPQLRLGGTMEAKRLIGGASFGPVALKTIGEAFDLAWDELEPSHSATELARTATRLKLAKAVLSVSREDSRDANELKEQALATFSAAKY